MKRFLMMMTLIGLGKLELDVDRPTRLSRFIVFERGLTRDKHCRRETLDKGGGG